MKKKVLEALLVIWIVMTLLMLDFVTLATGISYAWDNTNSENIEFSSYFKLEDGEKIYSIKKAINSQDIKLCMDIEVKNAGYLDGKIELVDKNFKFKQEQVEGVNEITDYELVLSQINSGEKMQIEIGIEPNFGESIEKASLNMDNKIALKGTYENAKGKESEIEVIKNVKIELTSPYIEENEGAKLEAQIITNKVYEINGENKKVVQVLIKSGLENDGYPIKQTNIEIEVPEGVEKVEAEARETTATNGKKEGEIEYTQNENRTNISILNEEIDGKISYVKQGQDSVIVTYIYSEEKELSGEEIKINSKIELYDESETKIERENIVKIEEEKDEIIGYEIESEQEIYKGKLYSKEGQGYKSVSKIDIRYPEIEKNIQITEGKSNYTNKEANVVYKKSNINKEELLKVIGDEGELVIKKLDGTEIKKITKETEDENGEIVINYEENQNEIIIEINNAKNTGIITIEHEKEIKTENDSREELNATAELNIEGTLSKTNNINERKVTSKINLKESHTKAELEINKKELSTEVKNENVEIKATLLTNDAQYDLYKNPSIEIEFPKEIEKIDANSINLIYGEGMEIKEAGLYKNEEGKNIIKITIEGEQTSHISGDIIKGASVIINCDLTVSNLEESKNENIVLRYTNENVTQYDNNGTTQTEIKYVVPEKVEENQEVQVVSTTEENVAETETTAPITITKSIAVGNGNDIYERQAQRYILTIKNNTDSDISNVTIQDQIPSEMIYCDLVQDMGFRNGYIDNEEIKSFTYTIKTLEANSVEKIEYSARVRQGTEIQGKTVGTKASAQIEGNEEIYESNLVENTIKESKFQTDMYLSDNASEYYEEGTELKYIIKVKNITNETQKGVIVTDVIPNDMKYVSSQFLRYNETNQSYYEDSDDILENDNYDESTKTVIWEIGDLAPGAEVGLKLHFELDRMSSDEDVQGITNSVNIKADGTEQYPSSIEIVNQVNRPRCTIEMTTNMDKNYVYEGEEFKFVIKAKCETLNGLTSGKLVYNVPAELEGLELMYSINENDVITATVNENVDISLSIADGDICNATIRVRAKELPEGTEELTVSNVASLSALNMDEIQTDPVEVIIKKKVEENPDNPDVPVTPDNPENPENPDNPDEPSEDENKKYSISGLAWLDENRNGLRDNSEGILQGITVILFDEDGKETGIETTTDKNGKYKFENLEKGKYIVAFKYDSNNYSITEYQKEGISASLNNDAVKAVISENMTVGLTDIINIADSDVQNIDIGLLKNEKFDLKLEKSITRIVAQNSKTTEVREYNDTNLAKIDIDRKTINGTNIIIEYKIKITNEGEVAGYAKKIVDYMPKELEFSSELNKEWYISGQNLISTSLSDTIINPGETKTLSLVLTKDLTEDNIGTITNTAEILEDYNDNIISDIDSVAGNKKANEDDMSTVSAIISIKTGREVLYVALSISVMLTLGIGIYLINKKVLPKEN